MAKFQVNTPGGVVEITADSEEKAIATARDSWESLPKMILQNEEKLRIFERPNGQRYAVSPDYSTSDPKQIEKLMEGAKVSDLIQESNDTALLERGLGTARMQEFVRGFPFVGSYIDELAGAVVGPEAQQLSRDLSGAMGRQRPGEALTSNFAGGAVVPAGLLGIAPKTLGPLVKPIIGQGTRLAQSIRGSIFGGLAGGAEGSVYGFGEGTTPEERLETAETGAKLGATFGSVLGGSGGLFIEGAQALMLRFRGSDIDTIAKEFGISTDAAKVIKTVFDQGGDIEAAQDALMRAGNEGMLADAGPAARVLLDAASTMGGRAGQQTRTAVNERMARTRESLESTLDTQLGPAPLGPRTAVQEISARSAPQRREAYDRAYAQPIDYAAESGRRIENIVRRMPADIVGPAIRKANDRMVWDEIPNQQIMADIADDGTITFIEMPNVVQLDYLKKAVQNIAYSSDNVDQFGRLNADGNFYNRIAKELMDAVGDAVPEYRSAVRLGGDKISEERAFALGRSMLGSKIELEDVIDEFTDASSDQIAAGRAGLRSYIAKTLDDVRAIVSDPSADELKARQVIQAVRDISSDNSRAKIRSLMQEEADTLLAQIDAAAQSALVRSDLSRNSMTASRLSASSAVDDITAPGIKRLLEQGEIPEATKEIIRAITGSSKEYSQAQRQKLFVDISKALTEKRGEEAQIALRVLDQAIKGQELTERQIEELSQLIGVALFSATTPTMTRGAMTEERAAQ